MDVFTVVAHTLSRHFGTTPDRIGAEDSLDKVGVDSTTIVEVLLDLENACGVEFDMEQLEVDDLRTVGTLTALIGRLRGENTIG